ncbi:MAG: ATP-binding protein [Pseudomonadota bacterium]
MSKANIPAFLFRTEQDPVSPLHWVVATALLAGAAVLGNYLAVPLFYGVDLIFGSVAVLVALGRLGLLAGILVAVAGGMYTLFLWHHPYALLIFTAEAVVVGWLLRRDWSVILADLVYWLGLGIPLVFLFYFGAMEKGWMAATVIALKQPLNGVFNAVVASFLLMAARLAIVSRWCGIRFGLDQKPRLRSLLFSILFAALLLPGIAITANEAHQYRQQLEESLLERMELAAALMAEEIATAPPGDGGTAGLAHSGMLEDHGLQVAMLNENGEPMGEHALMPARSGGKPMDTLVDGLHLEVPADASGSTMQRRRQAHYFHRTAAPERSGVAHIVVRAAAAPLVDRIWWSHVRQLSVLGGFMVLASLAAILVSRWLTAPLIRLNRISEDLPERIMEGRVTAPHLPRSGFSELDGLSQGIRRLALTMASGFSELRGTRDNLERRVEERTHALERNNEELRRLAEVAAHHLMEPVRRLMAYSQRLGRELPESETAGTEWRRMQAQIQRMSALLEDLQRYLAHQTTTPSRETVRLERVVNRARVMLAAADDDAEPVRVVFAPDPPPPVHADFSELVELFRQLLSNARAYARPGDPPEVVIQAEESGEGVVVTIRDNGRGFEPVYGERIFRLFERLYPERDGAGTGLGLALARRIVENHGGWITAESTGTDRGAAFRFMLPGRLG